MDVKEAIDARRAYRSLEPVEITEELVEDLSKHAQLAPSCFNNQPEQYVFVYEPEMLKKMHEVLSKGNVWAHAGSMIIVVFGQEDDDCVLGERIYYLFDIGLATAFMILRATELGLVAHPIAGFDEDKVKDILGIPAELRVITLVIIGKKSAAISPVLSDKQITQETERPERKQLEEFVFKNQYIV
ncbi:MAG: nitroreductase family protein [Thermoplasmata archaeon]|nr:nitroreductase family protein [Thermoplasmata archaeon]